MAPTLRDSPHHSDRSESPLRTIRYQPYDQGSAQTTSNTQIINRYIDNTLVAIPFADINQHT